MAIEVSRTAPSASWDNRRLPLIDRCQSGTFARVVRVLEKEDGR
jgi:hypothetical protein